MNSPQYYIQMHADEKDQITAIYELKAWWGHTVWLEENTWNKRKRKDVQDPRTARNTLPLRDFT